MLRHVRGLRGQATVGRRPAAGRNRGLGRRRASQKSRCHARGVAYEDERAGIGNSAAERRDGLSNIIL